MSGLANTKNLKLGGGAQFWVYLSPQNNTAEVLKTWSVTISQGNWKGTITSDNPTAQLQTPGLSGTFTVEATTLSYSTNPPMTVQIPPQDGSSNEIGCNSNCASMVGLVAVPGNLGGSPAQFWTTWDAMCTMS